MIMDCMEGYEPTSYFYAPPTPQFLEQPGSSTSMAMTTASATSHALSQPFALHSPSAASSSPSPSASVGHSASNEAMRAAAHNGGVSGHAANGGVANAAEDIWDLDSHTVKRYNSDEMAFGLVANTANVGMAGIAWDYGLGMDSGPFYLEQTTTTSPTTASTSPTPATSSSNMTKRVKTYQCEACDKWFTSSGHLKRHFNTTTHKNALRQSSCVKKLMGGQNSSTDDMAFRAMLEQANSISPSPRIASPLETTSTHNVNYFNAAHHHPYYPVATAVQGQIRGETVASNNNAGASDHLLASVNAKTSTSVYLSQRPSFYEANSYASSRSSSSSSNNNNNNVNGGTNTPEGYPMGLVTGYTYTSSSMPSAVNSSTPSPSPAAQSSFPQTHILVSRTQPESQPELHFNLDATHYFGDNGVALSNGVSSCESELYDLGSKLDVEASSGGASSVRETDSSSRSEMSPCTLASNDIFASTSMSSLGILATSTSSTSAEFKCGDCNKSFSKLCYLKQHNKSFHNGEKPFKCNQCGKRFALEGLFKEHVSKHLGDKPYKCEVCPKQFNHKTDLRRHMCLHTGEKPFACEVCGKGFIREDRMIKHAETHKKRAIHD